MDRGAGVLWEIFLDIEAVACSCGNDMVTHSSLHRELHHTELVRFRSLC